MKPAQASRCIGKLHMDQGRSLSKAITNAVDFPIRANQELGSASYRDVDSVLGATKALTEAEMNYGQSGEPYSQVVSTDPTSPILGVSTQPLYSAVSSFLPIRLLFSQVGSLCHILLSQQS